MKQDRSEWHRWFAWRPVALVTGERAWMQTVERMQECAGCAFYADCWYFDELAPAIDVARAALAKARGASATGEGQ